MNLNHIKMFLAVAEAKSVSGAADQLGTSQPVISRTIKTIEEHWGVELFDRLPRGVELSSFGQTFYRHATNMMQEYNLAREEVLAMRGGNWGVVRIGAGMHWLDHGLPTAVRVFLLENPDYLIDVKNIGRDKIVKALLDCKIDVGLCPFDLEDHSMKDIVFEELFVDENIVIARADHPLAEAVQANPEKIADLDWALTHTSYVENKLEQLFKQLDTRPPQIRLRCPAMRNILEIISESDFVTLAPRYCLDDMPSGKLIQLAPSVSVLRRKGILLPKNRRQSLATKKFVSHIRETFGKGKGF